MNAYDVIVIGAGHAGCEAALVTARMGIKTALVTIDSKVIARMSCNPSVGGIGKSHLVCELDALGGEIAVNTDYTGIQFRILNTRKGPAVQSYRTQCDKSAFSLRMQAVLNATKNLTIIEDLAIGIWMANGKLRGIQLKNSGMVTGKTVILAVGTFLNGIIHIGKKSFPGGRHGEQASARLSQSLRNLGLSLERFKTGTPPRLDKKTINYAKMTIQPGIEPPALFSRSAKTDWRMFHVEHHEIEVELIKEMFHVEHFSAAMRPWLPGSNQLPCFLTHTTPKTHDIIRANLDQSSLYGGNITSTGVRYCPSIEDKIVKFSERSQHHVFIEPEGRSSMEIYPNGLSNSLPEAVQIELIKSVPGLEHAKFIHYAYAIEYDYLDPTQLTHSLELKSIENLFLAGQINGTTGYEEAAAQGIVAGINAAMKVLNEKPIHFSRNESYIGVLVDDLVTKGIDEPYRMFTSRAEHRLLLRQDNAIFRMLNIARKIGVVPKIVIREIDGYIAEINNELTKLNRTFSDGRTLIQILCRPEMKYKDLPGAKKLPDEVIRQIEIRAKYQGYIEREEEQIRRMDKSESVLIPPWIDYNEIKALKYESRQKLTKIRPDNLGQASRISGVNPSDIAILSVWIKCGRK
ncbi:MAG: FAD-dependent oxidoreductase [Kiritimatiellia bacterium]|nr:FAD-dependent oxidoreductase [Kiritimatiellia bacterium]